MSDYDVQTLLSRATPRRANGDPIENEMSSVNSDVLPAGMSLGFPECVRGRR